MLPDRLGAARLVHAHGSDGAVGLGEHVAADPADVVGHAVALDGRAVCRLGELVARPPAATTKDHIGLHGLKAPLFDSVRQPYDAAPPIGTARLPMFRASVA